MFQINHLKARLEAGEVAFGCWVSGGSVATAELLAHIGFDFLLFDHEHAVGDTSAIADELRAVSGTPTSSVVRVPWNDQVYLKRVLDIGVQSVMIPQIESAEEAKLAVAACMYPPVGRRGYAASVVRASTYGLEPNYTQKANANLLTICQVESASAINHIDEICAVEGLDCVFIGVNDLAGSIGKLEQTDHPAVRQLVDRAEDTILRSGKIMGTVPSAGAAVADLLRRGYRLIAGPHEVALLRSAAKSALKAYQEASASHRSTNMLRSY